MVTLVKTWAASANFTQRLVRVPDYAKEETLQTKAASDKATTRLKWAQLRNTVDLSLSCVMTSNQYWCWQQAITILENVACTRLQTKLILTDLFLSAMSKMAKWNTFQCNKRFVHGGCRWSASRLLQLTKSLLELVACQTFWMVFLAACDTYFI